MYEDNPRGTGRMLVGMILVFSSFVNFFSISNGNEVFLNLFLFVLGVCLTFWGYIAGKNSEQ